MVEHTGPSLPLWWDTTRHTNRFREHYTIIIYLTITADAKLRRIFIWLVSSYKLRKRTRNIFKYPQLLNNTYVELSATVIWIKYRANRIEIIE